MTYLSFEFFVSFLAFFCLYWLFALSPRVQNLLLILASYGIVASFHTDFAWILFAYTLAIHGLAHFLYQRTPRAVHTLLIIVVVCALLFVFKYYDFFAENINALFTELGLSISLPILSFLLPIGISFYTFHSVSYVLAVKKGDIAPIPLIDLLLYLSFFPSVVAGPINRIQHFLPQIQATRPRNVLLPREALILIALAITKLFFLSSWLASAFANPVFSSPALHTPEDVLLGLYAYSFQIYFNFSGYTELVTAIALCLGFSLPQNFQTPYLSKNLSEFWRRWHMSLSFFIRDYVYIPLGGNRYGFWRTQMHLMVAMLLSGLWHGAGLNFIIWGGIHGLGLVALNICHKYLPGPGLLLTQFKLSRLITFHVVVLSWIFFRSEDLESAYSILSRLSELSIEALLAHTILPYFIVALLAYPALVSSLQLFKESVKALPNAIFLFGLTAFIYLVILFSPSGVPEFIYARF